jgi:predicted RNA methylase
MRRKEEQKLVSSLVIARTKQFVESFPLAALPGSSGAFSWIDMPPSLSPLFNLTGERGLHKMQQCESYARALSALIRNRKQVVVVDFGSGSGNASLPLAFWFRNVASFVLVDRFEEPIRIAKNRVEASGLKSVECLVSHINDFDGKFDICFSSHACGSATDDALAKALKIEASFCLTSCCVGKMKFCENEQLPRSKLLHGMVARDEFLSICKAGEHDSNQAFDEQKFQCKILLEADRMQLAKEAGYSVTRTKLEPLTCSPKNDLIWGEK